MVAVVHLPFQPLVVIAAAAPAGVPCGLVQADGQSRPGQGQRGREARKPRADDVHAAFGRGCLLARLRRHQSPLRAVARRALAMGQAWRSNTRNLSARDSETGRRGVRQPRDAKRRNRL